MTGTAYVIAFDSLLNDLDERSKAIRLKLDTACAHHNIMHKRFHMGQLDAIQAIRAKLHSLRQGTDETTERGYQELRPVLTHGKLRDDFFGH